MSATANRSVTVTLDGSNKSTRLPLIAGTIGPDVFDIRKMYADLGVFTYDPGYGATASCDSKITYIDGDEGILMYRGYPIEQLAEKSNFLEVCYLLLNGELPNEARVEGFRARCDASHHAARAASHLLQRLPPRRAPDGGDVRRGWRAVGLLSRQPRHPRPGKPPHQRIPPDRQSSDHRRLGAQICSRPAVRLSAQRPDLRGKLPAHVPCRSGRGLQGQPGAVEGDGPDHDPARGSRAERLDQHGAPGGLDRRQPVRLHRRRHRQPVGPRAWRRQRGGAEDADRISAT